LCLDKPSRFGSEERLKQFGCVNDNLPLFRSVGERSLVNPNQELPDPLHLNGQVTPSKHIVNVLIHQAKRIVLTPRLRFYCHHDDP
jgi:hypothetical protein